MKKRIRPRYENDRSVCQGQGEGELTEGVAASKGRLMLMSRVSRARRPAKNSPLMIEFTRTLRNFIME